MVTCVVATSFKITFIPTTLQPVEGILEEANFYADVCFYADI